MKRIINFMAIPVVALLLLTGCQEKATTTSTSTTTSTPTTTSTTEEATTTEINGIPNGVKIKTNYNKTILDYSSYESTSAYKIVRTPKEFLDAIYDAKFEYTNTITGDVNIEGEDSYVVRNNVRKNASNWTSAITKGLYLKNPDDSFTKIPSDIPYDPEDTNYTASMTYYEDSPYAKVSIRQEVTKPGEIRVIEIANDLDLGYNLIKDLGANQAVYENWDKSDRLKGSTDVYSDPDLKAAGISKIKVTNSSNLVIYSKNGAKLTHCGFEVSSCYNVSFRNLSMDEIWMWEDSTSATPTIKVGDYDSFGWAYFKVSFSEGVWIDHCTFGKSFDGQIDYSNPYYTSKGTYQKAPIGASGNNGLNVSYCKFNAGSDDPNGYLYKMMDRIENEYQEYLNNGSSYTYSDKSCRYYFTLRDAGLEFDEILYGIAIPQKKAFLWGDSGDSYLYNKYLQATLSNCILKNVEDRIPKVRGGMAYVYNTLVDNTEYLSYVSTIKSYQSTVQQANSKYKLGGVSQGILAGLDASVYLESVEYKGILNYLKNNDSAASDKGYPTVNGGYMIVNSMLSSITGSTDKDAEVDPFIGLNSSTSILSINNFSFKVNGEKTDLVAPPFKIDAYDLITNGSLDSHFEAKPAGTLSNMPTSYWLKFNK